MTHILRDLRGELVVSCQATEDSPLHPTEIIVALARAAEMGGAKAVRIEGVRNVAAVRGAVTVPVIGITKISQPNGEVYITPTVTDAQELCDALNGRWRSVASNATISAPAATFVVVGSAITRPDVITRRFADAVAAVRLDPEYNGEIK